MTAQKAGYITQEKAVTVTRTIKAGQGADASLSKVLPADGWRAVVEWDANSRDVDSHTYFGAGGGKHVYWPSSKRSYTAPGTGGIKVVLDRDDVSGFGPETTTFLNVGKCTVKGNCLIKFKVKNYSYRDHPLGESNVKVVLYNADKVHSTYTVPASVSDGSSEKYLYHPIFTIDATEDNVVVHQGDFILPPFITTSQTGSQNWWGSLDYSTWSTIPTGSVMYGMYTTGGNRIYNIEMAKYYKVQGWDSWLSKSANWWGSFDRAGWSLCEDGWFLSGFYRTGHMRDWNQGTYQIEMGKCVRPKEYGGYGTCNEQSILQSRGWTQCGLIDGQPSAIVGLWRSNSGDIRGIDKAKCCTFKQ